MKRLGYALILVVVGTAAGALLFALTPTRYRASSTVRFTHNVCPIGLVDDKLRRQVNDVRWRLLGEVGSDPAVIVAALEATDDTSASLMISYDSKDAGAAAREAARLAQRFRDIFTNEWKPAPTQETVDPVLTQRLSDLKDRLLAIEAALRNWKKGNASASPPPELTRDYAQLQADYIATLRSVDDSRPAINDVGPPCDWTISILNGIPETVTLARFPLF